MLSLVVRFRQRLDNSLLLVVGIEFRERWSLIVYIYWAGPFPILAALTTSFCFVKT